MTDEDVPVFSPTAGVTETRGPSLSATRWPEIPDLFPRLQSATALELRKHDTLQLHDLFDLFGQ